MAKKASKAVAPAKAEVTAQPEAQQPAPENAPVAEASTETDMACATCGGVPAGPTQFEGFVESRSVDGSPPAGWVLMKFTGTYVAPVTYLGQYSGCVTCTPVYVNPGDVSRLEGTGAWVRVEAAE
jgi:hypothetical protein